LSLTVVAVVVGLLAVYRVVGGALAPDVGWPLAGWLPGAPASFATSTEPVPDGLVVLASDLFQDYGAVAAARSAARFREVPITVIAPDEQEVDRTLGGACLRVPAEDLVGIGLRRSCLVNVVRGVVFDAMYATPSLSEVDHFLALTFEGSGRV
jgi:hypothetical protein